MLFSLNLLIHNLKMKTVLIPILLSLCHIANAQENLFNYFPKDDSRFQIIHYENYTVAYSEAHEQAS